MKRIRGIMSVIVVVMLAGSISLHAAPAETRAGDVELTVNEEGLYSLRAEEATLGEVRKQLADVTGVELDVPPVLLGKKVTVELKDATLEDLLGALAGSRALVYERDEEGNYHLTSARLTSQEVLEAQELTRRQRRDIRRKKKQVRRIAKRIAGLYGYAGVLNYDEARALIDKRKEEFNALVDELAALGPGGARAMRESFADIEQTRGKLAVIKALSKIDDPEASLALGALYEGDYPFSLEREIVASLGHRKDDPFTQQVLEGILEQEDDKRLLAGTIMALSGQKGAVETLADTLRAEEVDSALRRESVRSLGEIGGAEALDVLSQVASSSGDAGVRRAAIMEIGRTFGDDGLATLETLLTDPDEGVAITAVKAINLVDSEAAQALLQKAAQGGASGKAREWAQSYVSSGQP